MTLPLDPVAGLGLGHYPPPRRTVVHLSDTHFLGGSRPLHGAVDTDAGLARALDAVGGSGRAIDAIVITGDLADLGEPDAYRRLRDAIGPTAQRLGAELVWVMGNHDERLPFAEELLRIEPTLEPLDRVHWVGGLRIIALDSSVPGYHHGDLTPGQLERLRAELAVPAPEGTLIALHHPPLPSPIELMAVLELHHQDAFAEAIAGSDVRAILAGHLHHPTFGGFAGFPVSVASATCYTIDASAELGSLRGIDGGRSFNLVELRDTGVTHSVIPVDAAETVSGFSTEALVHLARMSPEERLEAFSRKRSLFGQAEAESSTPGAPNAVPS